MNNPPVLPFFLVLLFCNSLLFGQRTATEISKSEVFKDRYRYSNIMGMADDNKGGSLVLRAFYGGVVLKPKGYVLTHYSNDMQLVSTFKLVPGGDEFMGMVVSDNTVHLISREYNQRQKQYDFFAENAAIDSEAFEKQLLMSVKSPGMAKLATLNAKMSKYAGENFAGIVFDQKKEHFLLAYFNRSKRDGGLKWGLFDKDLNRIQITNSPFENAESNFLPESITVSQDQQNLYVVGRRYFKRKKSDQLNRRFAFEVYKTNSDTLFKKELNSGTQRIAALKPLLSDGHLLAVGFYSNKRNNQYKGLSYFGMDKETLAIQNQKNSPFTTQFLEEKYGREKNAEVKNLLFRDLHISDSGDIIFNAEEYFATSNYRTNPSGSGMWVHRYHYNDIVCARLSKEGDLLWARNINKKEVTQGDEAYVSYTSFLHNNNSCFFINTGKRPQKMTNNRIIFKEGYSRHPNLFLIQIDAKGELTYEKVIDNGDLRLPIMVSKGLVDYQHDHISFLARKGSNRQLIKIDLKNSSSEHGAGYHTKENK